MDLFGLRLEFGTLLIPVFAGLIGWGTNWLAIRMMFYPVRFVGQKMPFRVLGFPVFGWQGIIPAKAAKMGSIAVDTGLARLGTMSEFYRELEPEVLAAQIVRTSREQIRELVDQIIAREYPDLWRQLPEVIRNAVHTRVEAELPGMVARVTEEIGEHIDRLVDLKLMVIRHIEANPKLMNRIFQEVGNKEFRFIVNSGLWLGLLLGLVPMAVWLAHPAWYTVPIGAAAVGYATNWIALRIIFEPTRPVRLGPFTVHGLFLRRQPEVAEVYSDLIAYELVTLKHIAQTMFNGPDGDRTQRLIADTLKPVVDQTIGIARPAVRVATRGRIDAIRDELVSGAVRQTVDALTDDEFVRGRAGRLQRLLATRMRALPSPAFAEMLRSAFREDEWQLIVVGALLGFAAGVLQLFLTL